MALGGLVTDRSLIVRVHQTRRTLRKVYAVDFAGQHFGTENQNFSYRFPSSDILVIDVGNQSACSELFYGCLHAGNILILADIGVHPQRLRCDTVRSLKW